MATNPGTGPRGTLALVQWEIQMTFGYGGSGDSVRTSEASFELKQMA